jgi:DNA-directed RNA polymerase specialized sigma54-like protein
MKKWHVSPDVVLREEADDWGVLFDPDTGNNVVLNPMAISMFKLMRKGRDSEEIAAAIRAEYDEVPETLSADITELIESLAAGGFIGFENG